MGKDFLSKTDVLLAPQLTELAYQIERLQHNLDLQSEKEQLSKVIDNIYDVISFLESRASWSFDDQKLAAKNLSVTTAITKQLKSSLTSSAQPMHLETGIRQILVAIPQLLERIKKANMSLHASPDLEL